MKALTLNFRAKLRLIKWLIPFGLVLFVIAYEFGPSRWVYDSLGFTYHLIAEILLFGTVGPALAFLLLELFGRWTEEKETADLQANLLARAKQKELEIRELSDDTLQVLFAASLLITTFKSNQPELSPNTATRIEVTEQALHEAIQRVSSQLMDQGQVGADAESVSTSG